VKKTFGYRAAFAALAFFAIADYIALALDNSPESRSILIVGKILNAPCVPLVMFLEHTWPGFTGPSWIFDLECWASAFLSAPISAILVGFIFRTEKRAQPPTSAGHSTQWYDAWRFHR